MDDRDTDTTEGEEKPLICEGYDYYYFFTENYFIGVDLN